MFRRTILFAAPLLVAAISTQSSAGSWRSYHNDRFGATANVPAGWIPQPPPENGDGLIFQSPDGRATITVSGILATGAAMEEVAERLTTGQGEKITYSATKRGAVVLSGLRGDTVFYRRSIASCHETIWNSIAIEYPSADKLLYDAVVRRVSISLRNGRGWMCAP